MYDSIGMVQHLVTFTLWLVQLTNTTSSDLNQMDFKRVKWSAFRNNDAPLKFIKKTEFIDHGIRFTSQVQLLESLVHKI